MSLVTEFREPVRWLLGDHDDEIRMYEDATIDRGVRVVVKSGQVKVNGVTYELSGDNLNVDPDVPSGRPYLVLIAKVALGFVSANPDRQSMRTRAFSESIGGFTVLKERLEQLIYEAESGDGALGFQNYLGWVEGYSGMGGRTWGWMTRLEFTGMVDTVRF